MSLGTNWNLGPRPAPASLQGIGYLPDGWLLAERDSRLERVDSDSRTYTFQSPWSSDPTDCPGLIASEPRTGTSSLSCLHWDWPIPYFTISHLQVPLLVSLSFVALTATEHRAKLAGL